MSHIFWYSARSAGLISWAMLTCSVALGLPMSTKIVRGRGKGPWMLWTHRMLAATATVFTLIHVVAIMLDSYINFSFADVLIPFSTSWHPLAVSWGIIGFWLILAIEISSLLKSKLPNKLWKQIHLLSFLLYIMATIHGLSVGSDTRTMTALSITIVLAIPISVIGTFRILDSLEQKTTRVGYKMLK